ATILLDGKEIKDKSPAELFLQPGKYQIKAAKAGYASKQKTLEVLGSNVIQEEALALRALSEEKYALLIGVQKATPALPSFVHAEADVEALGQALQAGGFKADKVTVLTQARGRTTPGELPSAVTIKQRLGSLSANSTPVDILV